jgi:hypothetical protein
MPKVISSIPSRIKAAFSIKNNTPAELSISGIPGKYKILFLEKKNTSVQKKNVWGLWELVICWFYLFFILDLDLCHLLCGTLGNFKFRLWTFCKQYLFFVFDIFYNFQLLPGATKLFTTF